MNFQTRTEMTTDTTFIDISERQLKDLHDKIFGEVIVNEQAVGMMVKLELTYIPLLLFIIIMVVAINVRWNRNFHRLNNVSKDMNLSEEQMQKIGMLKAQKLNIWDRVFVYLVVWGSALYLDTMLMASGIFEFPFLAIPVAVLIVYKKLNRLINTSTLQGVDDSDIKEGFDNILDKMIVQPMTEGLKEKIKKYLSK